MNDIEIYIYKFPLELQERLNSIRNIILELAPQATERICMKIPTYDLNGKWLVHFACFKKHIGFYPQPEAITTFKNQLTDYNISKGTIRFPHNTPLPLDLIRDIIIFRVNEQLKQLYT